MTVKELLNITEHRPWNIPAEKWKFYQEWNDVVFLHWQVELGELIKFVPKDLEIDLFEGKPWVSLVTFTMEKVRPKHLPAFSPISDFNEINCRTYVKYNGKTGVHFLSIEGGKKISCQIAKGLTGLPYRYSKMKRKDGVYHSHNERYADKFEMEYKAGQRVDEKTALDKWLTERYALFQDGKEAINQFEIHHREWPMQKVDVMELQINYPRFEKLLNNQPFLSHYSSGVQVLAWDKIATRKMNT